MQIPCHCVRDDLILSSSFSLVFYPFPFAWISLLSVGNVHEPWQLLTKIFSFFSCDAIFGIFRSKSNPACNGTDNEEAEIGLHQWNACHVRKSTWFPQHVGNNRFELPREPGGWLSRQWVLVLTNYNEVQNLAQCNRKFCFN